MFLGQCLLEEGKMYIQKLCIEKMYIFEFISLKAQVLFNLLKVRQNPKIVTIML